MIAWPSTSSAAQVYVFWNSHRGLEQANISGRSLFEAAKNALQHFHEWYGPKPSASTVLRLEVHTPGQLMQTFHVRAGRIVEAYGLKPEEWLGGCS